MNFQRAIKWFRKLRLSEILDLKSDDDAAFLQRWAKTQATYCMSNADFWRSITMLREHLLEPEWLRVYNLGIVGVKVSEKGSVGVSVLDRLLPCGLGLHRLSRARGFRDLVRKLNNPPQFIDTIFEIRCVLSFLQAIPGVEIELEPAVFRIEVQLEDPVTGDLDAFASRAATWALGVIQSAAKLPAVQRLGAAAIIAMCKKDTDPFFPQATMTVASVEVGPTPTRVDDPRNQDVRVGAEYLERYRRRHIGRLLNEAQKQIPKDARGVIMIECPSHQLAADIATARHLESAYSHIVAIVINPFNENLNLWKTRDWSTYEKVFPNYDLTMEKSPAIGYTIAGMLSNFRIDVLRLIWRAWVSVRWVLP